MQYTPVASWSPRWCCLQLLTVITAPRREPSALARSRAAPYTRCMERRALLTPAVEAAGLRRRRLPPLGTGSRLGAVLLLAVLSVACNRQPDLVFAQLTDLHLFDAGKSRGGKEPDVEELKSTKEALAWALAELARGENLDFVAITGDFGLELVGPYWEEESARVVARDLAQVPAKAILFLPGNNDLLDEDFRDLHRYRRFVDRLAAELGGHGKKVVDLSQAGFEARGVWVFGLESATFKNGCQKTSASACADAYRYQDDEMARLAKAVAAAPPAAPTLIFTHVPDLLDPYTQSASGPCRRTPRIRGGGHGRRRSPVTRA